MHTAKTFYVPELGCKHVEISDIVTIGGDTAHVVKLGRKYVEVLFYPGQPSRGRLTICRFRT